MAGFTGEAAGVVSRNDLRKALWFGGIGLVTAHAQHCRIELGGRQRGGVIGVFGKGTVACFAIHMRMFAVFLLIEDIGMAALTGVVSGVIHGPGRDFTESVAAVVPVLAETAGNEEFAKNEEQEDAGGEYPQQAKEMLRIFESVHGSEQSPFLHLPTSGKLPPIEPEHVTRGLCFASLLIRAQVTCRCDVGETARRENGWRVSQL